MLPLGVVNLWHAVDALEKRVTALEAQVSTTNDAIQSYTVQVEANFALLNNTALTNLKTEIAAQNTLIGTQNAQIVAFQAQLAAGTLSPTDAAALQQIVTDSGTLASNATSLASSAAAIPPVASPAAPVVQPPAA